MKTSINRYAQVKDYILSGISQGAWTAGARVPSENELVDRCNVSRMTARRALQELYNEGTLVRIQGKGSFVAKEKQQSSLLQIRSIAAEIRENGGKHHSQLLHNQRRLADQPIQQALQISSTELCGHSQLLHFQNQQPIQLEYRWVNLSIIPNYAEQDFSQMTPSEYLSSIAPVTEAEHLVKAIIGAPLLRELLGLEKNEAMLLLERKTWCNGQLVSYAKLYHPGNRYVLGTKFSIRD